MIRWIGRVAFLACSAVLLVWVCEGLFGVDQRRSVLPFLAGDTTGGTVILVGVFWGILLSFGGIGMFAATGSGVVAASAAGRLTALAVGTVTEVGRTGLTVNDVPQYDIYLTVTPGTGESFVSRLRTLADPAEIAGLQPGSPLPVRYDPDDRDRVAVADITEAAVRAAMLQWRVERGLIDPGLVAARTGGVSAPASVVRVRPTGRRLEGQVELALTLLVTPEDGAQGWEAETTSFVYPQALSHVQVGSPVYAMYLPHDPATVAMTIERAEA